ncbi:MAG TPA: hypothetical protein VGA77_10725 [Propylenella sp.]
MTRTNTPDEDVAALNRRMKRKDEPRIRHEARKDAAGRLDVSPARLGSELAGDTHPSEESETADALKRTAENEGRP